MLDHVSLGVSNLDRSRRFYDVALRPLGLVRIVDFGRGSDYGAAPGSLGVEFTITCETGVSAPAAGAHLCFRAPSRCAVQNFHAAALTAGGQAHPGFGRNTMPTTMAPLCLIPTATASRPFVMLPRRRLCSGRGKANADRAGRP